MNLYFDLSDWRWWFGVVIVSLLVNLAASGLLVPIKKAFDSVSERSRKRTEAQNERRKARIERHLKTPGKLTELAIMQWSINTSTIVFLGVVTLLSSQTNQGRVVIYLLIILSVVMLLTLMGLSTQVSKVHSDLLKAMMEKTSSNEVANNEPVEKHLENRHYNT